MKTAVEWLQIMLIPTPYDEEDIEHNRKCWEQAKKMEEQEKVEFALRAYIEKLSPGKDFIEIVNSMRTFKQQEQ